MPGWYFDLVCGLAGLFFGSFFNVVIYRVPRRKSIVFPPSACPDCGAPIRFYDNLPVVSFLILRGRCRKCRARIAGRYPLVELLTALTFVAMAVRFGPTGQLLRGLLLAGFLIVLAAIDLEHKRIPDAISLPGLAVGLVSSLLVSAGSVSGWPGDVLPVLRGLLPALLGAAAGALVIVLVRSAGRWLFRKEAMGEGDILLAALIGSYLGWQQLLLTVFVAAVAGVVIGTIIAVVARRRVFGRHIPFGPYLALAGLVVYLSGPSLLNWYLGLFRVR
jgi:leader peptidase (prepilin peptidase)/N-methyltransferase